MLLSSSVGVASLNKQTVVAVHTYAYW